MTVAPERPAYASSYLLPQRLDAWLEAVENHYADAEIPLPERRYWTIGNTAHDCEQVAIAVQQMFLGTAGEPSGLVLCTAPRTVTFTLEIVRCTPTLDRRGTPPSGSAIEASSVDPVIDLEILLDLVGYFDPDNTGVMATADVLPAQGGFHGVMGTYTVTLL